MARLVAGSDITKMVGLGRLERPTSPLSGVCSNQLSYRPEPDQSSIGRKATRTGRWNVQVERETRTAPSRKWVLDRTLGSKTPDTIGLSNPARPAEQGSREKAILRKEVIQPQVPLRLPCYDFTPVAEPTVVVCPPCRLAQRLRVNPTPMV